MSAHLDPRIFEALSSSWDTQGLRKLLVVLAISESSLKAPLEGDDLTKSRSSRSQVVGLASKRRRDFSPVDPEELPPGLSTTAQYARLGEIATVSKGKTGIKDALPGPYPLVVTAEGRSSCDHFDFEGPAVVIPTVSSTGHGDASLKRIHFQEGKYAVGSILAAVHSRDERAISARFLYEYLSAFKDELLVSRMSGTANVSLTATKIEEVPVPLVSEAAQERVDKVMRLCDALEAKGQLEAAQHAQLVQTLLGALTASTSPEELSDNWQRVATHFDRLLDRPEAIDALEQTILQLAVRGLISPPPPNDQPVVVGSREESPVPLPVTWSYVRLGEVLVDLRYGTAVKCGYEVNGHPVLRIPNLKNGSIDTTDLKFGHLGTDDLAKLALKRGDTLIVRSNGSSSLVGSMAVVGPESEGFAYAGYLVRARLNSALITPEYLNLVAKTAAFREQIEGPIRTTSGVKNINSTEISRLSFALPPLGQQRQIVAHVESFRRLCADLRQRLAARQTTQAHLAEALIDEVA